MPITCGVVSKMCRLCAGPNHHRDRDPQDHGPIWGSGRCRMVWQRIHVDGLCSAPPPSRGWAMLIRKSAVDVLVSTHLWQDLHLLLDQILLPGRRYSVRGGELDLRGRPELGDADHRTGCRRPGLRGNLLRRTHHPQHIGSPPATTHLYRLCRGHVRWVSRVLRAGIPCADFSAGIASVAGPLLGGAFTDNVSWRWCFYINVGFSRTAPIGVTRADILQLPLGAITILVIILIFRPPKRDKVDNLTLSQKIGEFDWAGTGVLLPGIVCLLLALQWGGSKYPWRSGRIIGLLVTFGVLAIAFAVIQVRNGEKATLPLRILTKRSIASGCLVSFGFGSSFMILVFYIPIWFQAIQGVSATQSGIRNLPLLMGVTVFSIVAGGLTTWLGYYVPFVYLGSAILCIGSGLLTTFEVDTPVAKWVGYQFVAGIGIGLGFQQPMIAAQTVLKQKDIPIGSAAVVFFQTLGGALFISVAQNIFATELIEGIVARIPDMPTAAILNTGATALTSTFSPEVLPSIIQAYNEAITKSFYASVALAIVAFAGGLGLEMVSVKGKKIEAIGGA